VRLGCALKLLPVEGCLATLLEEPVVGTGVAASIIFDGKLDGMLLGKLLPEGEVDGSVLGSLLMVGS